MNRIYLLVLTIVYLGSCNSVDNRPLELPAIFSDHMVVQQTKEIAFWGTYTPNAKVDLEGSWGTTATTKADELGAWKTNLSTPEAGGPFTIKVITKDSILTINEVYSGEVWLASGQSNMEMPLTGFLPNEPVDNYKKEIANANYPMIREFHVPRAMSLIPSKEYVGEWEVCSSETAGGMSATAFFFARKLHQELNVPIGIINSSWGGTPVESWVSKEKLLAINEFEEVLEKIDPDKAEAAKAWYNKFPSVAVPSKLEEWSSLDLEDESLIKMDFDDSQWQSGNISQLFEELEGEGTDGAIWFRKEIVIDDIDNDFSFSISEGIDDADVTYFNGVAIGDTVCWNCPRNYVIPKSLLVKSKNILAIRMIDTGGPGGARGEISLKSENGKSVDITSDWKYKWIAGLQSSKFVLFHRDPELFNNPPEGLKEQNYNANTPTILFNAMIYPLVSYAIKGAIWYQGESNVGRADQYAKVFPGMIEDWRSRWDDAFPFYYAQIAPFNYGNELSPALREAQRSSLSVSKTGMAILMDVGSATSIHPGNKQAVGERLAKLALGNDYGRDLVTSGPVYTSHTVEGNSITVSFDHVGSGLMSKDKLITGFEISDEEGKFVPARATIIGDKVKLSSPNIANPKAVRYGWRDAFDGTLFNKEGLPASSFQAGLTPE